MNRSSTASQSGACSLGLIRLLLPVILLIGGGNMVYTGMKNRQPYTVTFADFIRTKPDKKWVELKETRLDVLDGITSGMLGSVSEVYIPMHAPGEKDGAQAQALMLTRDPETVAMFKQLKELPDQKSVMDFVIKNREKVFPTRTVQGLVQSGLDSSGKKRRKLEKLDANLASGFLVIEEGEKPHMGLGIIMALLALPAAWFCWIKKWGGSEAQLATPDGPSGPMPPPMPPSVPPTVVK